MHHLTKYPIKYNSIFQELYKLNLMLQVLSNSTETFSCPTFVRNERLLFSIISALISLIYVVTPKLGLKNLIQVE